MVDTNLFLLFPFTLKTGACPQYQGYTAPFQSLDYTNE